MQIIIEDFKAHREGLLAQGFWALLFYRFAASRFSFKSKLVRYPIAFVYIFLSKLSQVFLGIYIGSHAKIGRRVTIEHFGNIILHDRVVIGDDVIIRQGVTIGNRKSDSPNEAPVIGNRVSIGAGAKILGQIEIGDDVSIGANAVVISNIPSNSIAVGVPAIVKYKKSIKDD